MTDFVLTRALLEAGGIDAMVARSAPDMRLLTEAERAESLRQTLAARPVGEAAWLFGYGSLIWNPQIHAVEHRTATVRGWHRAFCLSTRAGRGTSDNPGLVLGLDAGGSCTGVAFRIAEDVLEAELALLWRREMLAGAYVPRWLDLEDEHGARFGSAMAFTVDPLGNQSAGQLAQDAVIARLASAAGELGSSADYLFRTCAGLHQVGIPDAELDALAAVVALAQQRPSAREET
jgi:cation transport protein ChaC